MSGKVRVALLFGGPGSEYEVSCASAAAILGHLDRERFEVVPVRVTRSGVWVVGSRDPGAGAHDVAALHRLTREEPGRPEVSMLDSFAQAALVLADCDVALPAFHGPYGEAGIVQAALSVIGVRYVGNGVLASAAGMDKVATKAILAAEGLRVTDGVVLTGDEDTVDEATKSRLGLPVFVKPAREGSSVGVSKVDEWAMLPEALARARKTDDKVLVEAAVPGREVDVAVLQHPDGRIVPGPPLEIRIPEHKQFFDYDAKYTAGGVVFEIPAELPPGVTAVLQEQAVRAFHALGCTGLLRVDFFLLPTSDGVIPVVNEVNTFPGFTAHSQYPRIWQAAGISYTELLTILLETALAKP
jgi:D-alanine-D-alanine ligase